MTIRYAQIATDIGPIFLAASEKGVSGLRLLHQNAEREVETGLADLNHRFAGQAVIEDETGLADITLQVQRVIAGEEPATSVPRDMPGTPYQQRCWDALVAIPWGQTCTYAELAEKAGKPRAIRAAASACAKNPVAFLVPCHRIVRTGGGLGGYFYGLDIKRYLLAREVADPSQSPASMSGRNQRSRMMAGSMA